jgi:hypothetical protein
MIQLGGRCCVIFSLSLVALETGKANKMCLNGTYSRVRVGKRMFPIKNGLKQGNALSPLLFNFAIEYAFRRVQLNQNDLKLNGTHQVLVYVADVNILGGNVRTVKKNTEALLVGSKEIAPGVNADTTSTWLRLEIRMQDQVII